ncbi:MAG: glycosyltransferase family 1 protein [Desulfovermiculus sp.]|nr:glycosyltransferase family 1 protein [Desulfovermiculus sp.]
MKILLDAIPLTGLLTGISRYLRNLYVHILDNADVQVDFFDGKRVYQAMPDQAEPEAWIRSTDKIWKLPDVAVVGLRSVHWLLFERRLRKILKTGKYDLYHETAFTPSAIKQRVPQVFTLHDLSLMHYRSYHPKERVWFSDLFFHRRIPEATQIIVPSQFIKEEVCTTLSLPENRVTAIPEAPDPFFSPRSQGEMKETKARLSLPDTYLLFVGTLEPRKNLDLIIEALGRIQGDIPLVLTGWKGWGDKPWMERAREYRIDTNIYLTGYIDEQSLACLYSGAQALLYPSKYEGFGLPVLEAMACGCPVISSNAASLPEVAEDAALYVDPHDPDSLAEAITRFVYDGELRQTMRVKGLDQAARFSWQDAAKWTIEVFDKVGKS